MTTLFLIGIGTGNPDHVTGQAIGALNAADLILIPRKGSTKSDLAEVRELILARVLARPVPVAAYDVPTRAEQDDYLGAVNDWHDAIAKVWAETIAAHPGAQRIAVMVWGDPSLYDSTLRMAARLPGVTVRVIPGITSLQALTAAHAIPLNTLAAPVTITTGRNLRDHGWPEGATTLAVMLDKGGAFTAIDPAGVTIWWGAYVGMPEECLIHGPLAEVSDQILATRTRLRVEHGWIMDIYLLRRGGDV
ncbi:precorrin-6A synthase (deacetylating) [Rhodobacter calidifons]|uniref:Precorrin-6A synthase [deacetylating] n=1 Tax=Rhodobacter calidifons TaxID=2715277 RepID=A0ABX0G4G6_9RHOB|nr:precorrin-6A synthase (deacetylating) [Rhodobacter calidifons]NHB75795.1 precorrin-6A synthase (deacetylating) [Rhodobacter calidifons]